MWKYEDGLRNAPDEGDPNEVGPAWIDTYDGDERISKTSRSLTGNGSLALRRSALPKAMGTSSR